MSLIETSTFEITKKQYFYKLKANMRVFFSLMIFQLVAISLLKGISSSASSTINCSTSSITINYISGSMLFGFTIIWAFVYAIMFSSKRLKAIDFSVVSNKLSSILSTLAFLLTCCFIGGITSSLGAALIRIISYILKNHKDIIGNNFVIPFNTLLMIFLSSTLYILLFVSLGYLLGNLFDLNKIFIFLAPFALFATLTSISSNSSSERVLSNFISFYTGENSILMFSIKSLITSCILIIAGVFLANRIEVER